MRLRAFLIFVPSVPQVGQQCEKGMDCFYTDGTENTSVGAFVDCNDTLQQATVTCYGIKFDVLNAAAVSGGIACLFPPALFSSTLYFHLTLYAGFCKILSNKTVGHVFATIVVKLVSVVFSGTIAATYFASSAATNSFPGTTEEVFRLGSCLLTTQLVVVSSLWFVRPLHDSPKRFEESSWKKGVRKKRKERRKRRGARESRKTRGQRAKSTPPRRDNCCRFEDVGRFVPPPPPLPFKTVCCCRHCHKCCRCFCVSLLFTLFCCHRPVG